MELGVLIAAVVVIACVLLNTISHKIGVPVLFAFILLGMFFGVDGLFKIDFRDFVFAENVCTVALIFIMFYGGFGTNWKAAKPAALQAGLLATWGVLGTAALTAIFCHFALHVSLLDSMLIGAVLSSTDAASVFSILRSKKLGLKYKTASVLELESGSNDPMAYMLTILVMSMMDGGGGVEEVLRILISQFFFGIVAGVVLALSAVFILSKLDFKTAGFDMSFLIGIALLSYSLAAVVQGNGYLAAYLCGIILGNSNINNKKALVNFFDGITGLMQMLLFFILGLLSNPSMLPRVFLPALALMLFLTLVARTIPVFLTFLPFRRPVRQMTFISFAGLRGAASIVFAVIATVGSSNLQYDLYHIVFCIVLLSIAFQGSFLSFFAKKLKMLGGSDVMRTFTDYSDELEIGFIKVNVPEGHSWAGCRLDEIILPPESLIVMMFRDGKEMIPDGKTVVRTGDMIVLASYEFENDDLIYLKELRIKPTSHWIGLTIKDFSPMSGELVIMIIREGQSVIPKGDTVIQSGDILVINSKHHL